MTTTKYYVRVAVPFDQQKQPAPIFHNFAEWIDEKQGTLRCCDDEGEYLSFTTYKEAEVLAQKISKFFYIVEVKEDVT
jgi:hypothetical protein